MDTSMPQTGVVVYAAPPDPDGNTVFTVRGQTHTDLTRYLAEEAALGHPIRVIHTQTETPR